MKILITAFVISIIVHLLFLKNYQEDIVDNKPTSSQKEIKKTDVKFVKLTPLQNIQSQTQEKPVEQKKQIKEITEEKLIKASKPKFQKKKQKKELVKTKKIIQKEEIIRKVEKEIQIKNENTETLEDALLGEQKVKNRKTIEQKALENFLSQKEPVNKEILNEINKLYGKEFETFTKVQKAFLEENLNEFQSITQTVLNRLGYPRLAAKLRIGGVNTVEFIFHPNGDITNLKIIDSSGYEILDEYTLELIQIAYKDYPKPKESTKLKFRVYYNLY